MVLMKPNAFQNADIERNILGYIAANKSNLQSLFETLDASDFNYEEHQRIFSVMAALNAAGKPTDLVSVNSKLLTLPDSNNLDELLADCMATKTCSTEWQAQEHAKTLKTMAFRRNLFGIFEDEKNALLDGENDAEAVCESARQKLRDIVTINNVWISMMDMLINAQEHIEKVDKGEIKSMPTGVSGLDSFMTGLHKGELTILGARPAVGKSALGMHMALAAADAGYKVAVCSREMTDIQYGARVLARGVKFPAGKLRTGGLQPDEWQQLSESYERYAGLDISFTFTTQNAEDLRTEVQKKIDSGGCDLLVVDYVQLMQTKRRFEMDYQRIGYVTKMLKDMTTRYNIAILALAQVGRSSEGSMPTMAELRGSGDIEQDADNIIFMHRPTDASDKWIDPRDKQLFETLAANTNQSKPQYISLSAAKQRQGNVGKTSVLFYPDNMIYTTIERSPQ